MKAKKKPMMKKNKKKKGMMKKKKIMPGKNKKKYTKKQMKIARVAEPRDRITAADFSMLRKYGKKKSS